MDFVKKKYILNCYPTHDSELQFTLSCISTLGTPGRRPVGAGPLVEVQAGGRLVHKTPGGPHRVWGGGGQEYLWLYQHRR